jgi:hypothetical protein
MKGPRRTIQEFYQPMASYYLAQIVLEYDSRENPLKVRYKRNLHVRSYKFPLLGRTITSDASRRNFESFLEMLH